MSNPQMSLFLGQFIFALLLSGAGIIICSASPYLYRRKGFIHGIAALLALISAFIPVAPLHGPFLLRLFASLLMVALLVLYRRNLLRAQSLEAHTIISYEHSRFRPLK
jgi:hypothetical protein